MYSEEFINTVSRKIRTLDTTLYNYDISEIYYTIFIRFERLLRFPKYRIFQIIQRYQHQLIHGYCTIAPFRYWDTYESRRVLSYILFSEFFEFLYDLETTDCIKKYSLLTTLFF